MIIKMARLLSEKEILELVSNLKSYHPDDSVLENIKNNLKKQLQNVKLYPEALPELEKEIIKQYESSFIHPGEMVGCIASTSIGSGQTQATLNSFHSSGSAKINLTSGVDRLNELLGATKNPKTPSLTIFFNKNLGEKLKDQIYINQICYSEIELITMRTLIKEYSIHYKPKYVDWWYPFFKTFYSNDFEQCNWRIRLRLDQRNLWKSKKKLEYIVKKIDSSINGKNLIKYAFSDELTGIIDMWIDSNKIPDPSVVLKQTSEDFNKNKTSKFVNKDTAFNLFITNILIPQVLKVEISGIHGVQTCYVQENKDGIFFAETKGGHLKDLRFCSNIDFLNSYSNDMWDMYNLFGLEASVEFLVREFKTLVPSVNRRHIELMVDWMCNTGNICSITRYGMDQLKVGPISKASFEQPIDAFVKAATIAQVDSITGVSSAIATGKLGKMGTGYFKTLLDVEMLRSTTVPEFEYEEEVILNETIDIDYSITQDVYMEDVGETKDEEELYFLEDD